MANYLIAVGGTGQHVALAVADFIALAHEIFRTPDEFPAVNLILVDADQAGGADQASAWQEARARLTTLGLFGGDSFECVPLPVHSTFADTRKMYEFVNRLGASFGPNAADALLLHEQREVDVTSGFYAQPRVGAMMADWLFGEVTRGEAVNPQLARIFHLAGDPGNRIVVAGSGVGGTGAGFAPALLRRLSSANGAGARLMALMATEWFRLAGACSNRLSESVQKTNANSALWHAAHSGAAAGVRTVLFGHPDVSRAPEEACQNGALQARKDNLTIPYYAAAAATTFFAGDNSGGTHIPAAAFSGDALALPGTLRVTPRLTLNDLVRANVEAVGRLTLVSEYLREPYRGFVMPFPTLTGRIDALDATEQPRIDAALAAKRAALANLGKSDEKLPVAPRHHRGLPTLRGWIRGKVDGPYDLWKDAPVPQQTPESRAETVAADADSATLLIRRIGFTGRVVGGNLVPVTQAQVRDLVTVDDVDVSKVPASDAASLTLGHIFRSWEARDVEEKRQIADSLVDDGRARRPVLVCGDHGDRPRQWLNRWLLLTNFLVEGRLTVEQRPLPFTAGKVLSYRGTPVGELSREWICLPLVNGYWNDEATVAAMHSVASRLETLATWCRNTAAVARCKSSRLPAWLDVLLFATADFAGAAKQHTAQSVPVQWTDGSTVSLPLPNGVSGGNDCVAATAEAFGVLVEQPPPDAMSPKVREIVDEISRIALTVPSLDGGEAKSVVFSELLSPAARDCLFGEVIVDVDAQKAWRLTSSSRIVTSVAGEVLTENVGCFRTEQRAKWLTPVRHSYIPLLKSGELDVRTDERGQELRVTLSLHGRTFMESYAASRVRTINPLLLHWPSSVASASADVTVLYDVAGHGAGPQTLEVVMHDAASRSWSRSPQLSQRHSLHYVATGSRIPYGLTFELEKRDVGFLKLERNLRPLDDGTQRVAVDFGTSATVVAIEGGPTNSQVVDLLEPRADATAEIWKGSELAAFQWYGTRSVDPEIVTKRRAPSALVYLGSPNDERPKQPRYGDHVLLDQDDWRWENSDASLMFDIKWTRDAAYRQTYLLHHLEQCIAAALSKGTLHSRSLSVTFTMPLRQRARAEDFVREIEAVTAELVRRTGVAIEPRFAYESEVIAPPEAPREDVDAIVVADLGGGTLDVFAKYFGAARRADSNEVVFDSARIGGHSLVEWLTRDMRGAELADYRRLLRLGQVRPLDDNSSRVARDYFDVVKRFTALWMDSVWRYWTGEARPGRVHVQLLGMGWSLPGSPGDQIALHLSDIARAVDSPLTYTRFEDALVRVNPKELLAMRALRCRGASSSDFVNFAPASVNGIEVTVAGQIRRDDEALVGLGANSPVVTISRAGLARLGKLTGAREEIVAEVRDRTRGCLTSRSNGVDVHDGAVIEGTNIWVASPLAIAAEMYTRQVLLHVHG
ncbi:MAG TPA: hypothetical protein VJ276_25515 [Thermoanaerobaculia bacterium]|nr:hypothetical protein [Thermoanaerobaculia bacterium]